jgi:hypothetical protein
MRVFLHGKAHAPKKEKRKEVNPTPETRELATGVLEYLRQHPEKHCQASFVGVDDDGEIMDATTRITENNFCDTTLCVAGTAVFLAQGLEGLNRHIVNGQWDETAAPLLGLNDEEASILFYTMSDETALEMLEAVANGDEVRFHEVYEDFDEEDSDY